MTVTLIIGVTLLIALSLALAGRRRPGFDRHTDISFFILSVGLMFCLVAGVMWLKNARSRPASGANAPLSQPASTQTSVQ